ncbi:hypothetical protein [Arthrobacter sp. ISL-5]|uniref:hypothetical protein n=1 Tax=Arthrobacter sp. ISL-5 TaxID=2819111 RepID=UPI001BE83518|nr:hypothetical protein [Arthrobacter sp. ISL-5]MBT2551554.1 hypothetical protein [Arthrobacter sp. ISL-5]
MGKNSMNQTTELEVLIHAPEQISKLLADAESALMAASLATRDLGGILITRHNPRRYTVAFSKTVPFGETHEHSKC